MQTETFYPEMDQVADKKADIIIERLYKMSKITCLNGIELKESRSITFQNKNKNNCNVYYATDAGVNKIAKTYFVSFSKLLD